jgi:MFS family permease
MSAPAEPAAAPASPQPPPVRDATGSPYAWYVLGVLVVVYVFNFLDRQILSILAERIKRDLNLSDAQIGFLYGTAFAIFYSIFGIPLGRLADVWDRRRLISIGLAFWSAMTALSGLARSFPQLALARIGVGVGEATLSPAAFSILSDYFPSTRRATVLAIFQSAIFIGSGLGLGIGGLIVERWDAAWAGATPPFRLHGWQVAFFVAGVPGLLLTLWARTLREPVRGQADGIFAAPEPHPFAQFGRELRAVLPPLTLLHLWLVGAGRRTLAINLFAAAVIAAGAALLTLALGTPVQWIALGIGLYAAVSWSQALRRRDRVCAELMLRTPSLRHAVACFGFLAAAGYGLNFWTAPFFIRVHGVPESHAGLMLGGTHAVAGLIGVMLGGVLADRWRQRTLNGRLYVAMLTAVLPLPFAITMLSTQNTTLAVVAYFPMSLCAALWSGPAVSTIQDLVLPRMRAIASAAYLLMVTFAGLAMGPYAIGRLSVALGGLRPAMLCGLSVNALALLFGALAARHLARDESTKLERARAAGEPNL